MIVSLRPESGSHQAVRGTSGGLSRLQYNSSQLGVVGLRVAKHTAQQYVKKQRNKIKKGRKITR